MPPLRPAPATLPLRLLARAFHAAPALRLAPAARALQKAPAVDITAHRHSKYPTARVVEPAPAPAAAPFAGLDVYNDLPAPASAIEAVYADGFLFTSGAAFRDGSGALMVQNEAFRWAPPPAAVEARARASGVLELGAAAWGLLDVIHPKPGARPPPPRPLPAPPLTRARTELLIVGTGRRNLMLSPRDRSRITELGIRMDVMDTANASALYNLLATERSGGEIAAALLVDAFGAPA